MPTAKPEPAEEQSDLFAKRYQPKWFTEDFLDRYYAGIAHAFILHGPGTTDYATQHNMSMRTALEKGLKKWACVVFYDRARGLTFSKEAPDAADTFRSRLGITPPPLVAGATQQDPDAWLRPYREPAAAIAALDTLLRMRDDRDRLCAFVVDMAEFIAPDADLASMPQTERQVLATLERWGRDSVISTTGNIVVLMCRNVVDLHSRLRSASAKYEQVEVPIPNRAERKNYVEQLRARVSDNPYGDDLNDDKVADHTAGLSRVHIEDVFLKAMQTKVLTLDLIKKRKEDIIRSEYGDVVQILEPRGGFESLGGYAHLKEPLTKRITDPLRKGKSADWGGIILVGPPGTGKTHLAEVIANEAGVNAIELRISKLLSKWVGESDKNLAKALSLIDSMVPCVVFIDELDVALPNRAGGDNDSGVSNRILAALMPFMADPKRRGRVVWVGATNRIDKVDAALKRVGRFDRIIPMLAPTAEDRESVLKVMMSGERCPLPECDQPWPHKVKDATYKEVAKKTEMWVGADLLLIVKKAHEVAKDKDVAFDTAFTEALTDIRVSVSARMNVEFQSLIAQLDCNDVSLLPKATVEGFKEAEAQARVKELEPSFRSARRDN
jgi:transitional endoplasmic reticulum ATPase